MNLRQVESSIESFLFKSLTGKSLWEEIERDCGVSLATKETQNIHSVGGGSYEITVTGTRNGIEIPVIVFVRFVGDTIAHYSFFVVDNKQAEKNNISDYRSVFVNPLHAIAAYVSSQESVDTILGYGCMLLGWSVCALLIYCANLH